MIKSDITSYNPVLIQADLQFIKLMIAKYNVRLIAGTGLHRMISGCEEYLALMEDEEICNSHLKPLINSYSLSDSLRILWMKKKEFGIQLKSMISGDFEYGKISDKGEHYYKDFELEIFTAAHLAKEGVNIELPQCTDGHDVLYEKVQIQCKHPDSLSRNKLDKYLRNFDIDLGKRQTYGVFCIGVEDFLEFEETVNPLDTENFQNMYVARLKEIDMHLHDLFDSTLPFCPRVLGVVLINTHYTYTISGGLQLYKTTNSVYCIRPNTNKIKVPDDIMRRAYEIVYCFNEKPFILIM